MKDEKLHESEWELLSLKEPAIFLESLIINVLYADASERPATIKRQQQVFEKWLHQYSVAYRDTIAQSVRTTYAHRYDTALRRANLQGRIAALSTLPIRKAGLRKVVDLHKVAASLHVLQAERDSID